MRSVWLLALKAEWLSWKCTLDLARAWAHRLTQTHKRILRCSVFLLKQTKHGGGSQFLGQEWDDAVNQWTGLVDLRATFPWLNTQRVGDTQSCRGLISGPLLTSCLFCHLAAPYTFSSPPRQMVMFNSLDHCFCYSNALQGVFGWLWNSLGLILIPLCDLHKEMRPSARKLTVSMLILKSCHWVGFPAKLGRNHLLLADLDEHVLTFSQTNWAAISY